MSYSNISYHPEHFGLIEVAELECSDACYQFDTVIVWKDTTTGQHFWAQDSGCSCPSPFEDFNRTNIDPLNLRELEEFVDAEKREADEWRNYPSAEDAADFLRKVKASVNG